LKLIGPVPFSDLKLIGPVPFSDSFSDSVPFSDPVFRPVPFSDPHDVENKLVKTIAAFLILFVTAGAEAGFLETGTVVWDSPSADARGSMPIGNGDIGLNVWVEPSGDLCLFIGKTDAWDENLRLLKLTKVRVKFEPPLKSFRQELKLRDGVIEIDGAKIWVDANHPVICIDAQRPMVATLEPWRKAKRAIRRNGGNEYFATGYTSLPAFSYPDTLLTNGWYHRNVDSPWLASMKLQKLDAIAQTETDPILNRTTGGIIRGNLSQSLRIHVLTQITQTPEQWLAALEKQADAVEKIPATKRWQEHCRWWNEFWDRSWIYVEGGRSLTMPVNHHPWRVGVASDGGNSFGGSITDPQVTGRALSAEEIAMLAGKPRIEAKETTGDVTFAGGCTVAAWIKPAAGEVGRILDKCTAGQPDGITFDTHPGLSLRWIVGDKTTIAPNCLKSGDWQHVAATVDAGTGVRRIYLNGKLLKQERDDSATETLTRAYALQRWVNACGGRGAFPIKWNGSIFCVDNRVDADYRAWGGGYWFQNTRLVYWPMLAAGDFDLMQPFIRMYMKALPARKLATRTYYGHDGAFYPETMTFWGNYLDQGDLGYGTNRIGKPDGLTDNQYIRRYWQGGLELVAMMLDYYDLTLDAKFRDTTLIPFATEILTFFDQHWKRSDDGKILFHPSQALETWWDCKNPTPEIAGLRYVIPRLQQMAGRKTWQKTLDDLPPVPLSADGKRIEPAEAFGDNHNMENPELYAVFPYRLFGVGKDNLEIARSTFAVRRHPGTGCWQQGSIQAALLGLTEAAQRQVLENAGSREPGFRFPAMFGTSFDWTPDEDHGGVMMTALQRMLLQCEGKRIFLLPAWPRGWDVSFKLHAPYQTTVECTYRAGKIEQLKVTPASRRKDVIEKL
jgi:hypothetical protein